MTILSALTPTCPLCDGSEASVDRIQNRDAYLSDCPVCGRFVFTAECRQALKAKEIKPDRFLLSSLTRKAAIRGERIELLSTNVADLLSNAPRPRTPHDILEPLLFLIHDRTPTDLTDYAWIPYDDYPLFTVPSADTLGEYIGLLVNLGLAEFTPHRNRLDGFEVRLTLAGWERVAELRRVGRSSNRAFVAMSFAPELDSIWKDGLEPALREAGWEPVRMDRVEHNERIDDRIMAEIRRSGMVVADFTGNRQGVYFEAGFALGLGIPVVWTIAKGDLNEVHFDTRQYNHIDWTDVKDLRTRLRDRVQATLPPPPA